MHVLNKPVGSAYLDIPALLPGVNFFPSGRQPYFRTVSVLGAVPDHFYSTYGYTTREDYTHLYPAVAYGDWHPAKGGAPAVTIDLTLPQAPPNSSFALLLAVGVVMGIVNKEGAVEAVGYAGSGKILEVG